jgi:acetyl-CoA carboxylase alpha subunit
MSKSEIEATENKAPLNFIEQIIEEPGAGAHESFDKIVENMKTMLIDEISELQSLEVEEMVEQRYTRYRKFL